MLKVRCVYKIRFLRGWGIQAITLYPFIFFSSESHDVSESLLRHELEHIYQVRNLGWLKFYFSYLNFYFSFRRRGLNHQSAYWAIPHEVEARQKESLALSDAEWTLLGKKRTGSLDRS